jgi:electron transport complex protein RnfB
MEKKSKLPLRAVIREAECIGCTKCITACPVDAIIGSGKLMHTVITDECTGCELCVAPCPVDCIDMITVTEDTHKAPQYRKRYQARLKRLEQEKSAAKENPITIIKMTDNKKDYLAAALLRAQGKKIK